MDFKYDNCTSVLKMELAYFQKPFHVSKRRPPLYPAIDCRVLGDRTILRGNTSCKPYPRIEHEKGDTE